MIIKKIIPLTLILILSLYIVLSSFEGIGNVVNAGQMISQEEADRMCPGLSNLVNDLKRKYGGYNFEFYNTGIDWNEAIICEYQGHNYSPKNLFNVNEKYTGMWHCPVCGSKVYDNGTLCCASMDALRYMMDPRNSITQESIFQFKSLEAPDVTYDDVVRVIRGTFLDHEECARAVVDASQAYNINGYYLVAKMLTEHGTNGSTLSRGVEKDGVVYYNFFNMGAYGNSVQTIINNGTDYAARHGWNTKRASILGGAELLRAQYVGKGQNTCYYQKYNVVDEGSLFSHQYAQSILSAENEGRKLRKNYTVNGGMTGNHTFIIPVYTNMPASPQERPSTSTVNAITYEIAEVTANGGIRVRSRQDINSRQIGTISQGTTVKVLARAASQNNGYYWDLVISDSSGICGYVARNYIKKIGQGSNAGGSTPNEYIEKLPVTSIEISGPSIVPIGKTVTLKAKVLPEDAYESGVIWNSSNNNVATVDIDGKVTGISLGKSTITASAKDGSGVKGVYYIKTSNLPFTDVPPDAWYYNAAKYSLENNIIKGTTESTFAPADNLSRAMIVTILYRMEGEPGITESSKFPDVKDPKKYYYKAVVWASEKGIVNGYNSGEFAPADDITRQDLAVILNRYAKYKGKADSYTNDLSSFVDKNKVSSYALPQVQWAVGAGIITGNNGKTLNPKGTSTRAEAAAMLEKYCKKFGR